MREVSNFVAKLYSILEDKANINIIQWSPDGKSFIIIQPKEFCLRILNCFFRHQNINSFIRQLNKYDFHKVKSSEIMLELFGKQILEFKNLNFQKDRKDLLNKISRKKTCNDRTDGFGFDQRIPSAENFYIFQNHVINSLKNITEKFSFLTNSVKDIKLKLAELFGSGTYDKCSILIYEDDSDDILSFHEIFKDLKLNITIIDSSIKVIDILKHKEFNVVIFGGDFKTSLNLVRYLRSFNTETKIILTTDIYSNLNVDLRSLGVNEILNKPLSPKELINVVSKCVSDIKKYHIKENYSNRI